MDVSYGDDELDDLERNPDSKSKFDHKIVRAFRKVVNYIRQATDERDLYAHPGLKFKALDGDLEGLHSLRLNNQWRLIVEVRKGVPRNCIHIRGIEDYH